MYSNNLKITQHGHTANNVGPQTNISPSRNARSRSPLRGPRHVNTPGAHFSRSTSNSSSSAPSGSATSLHLSSQPNTHRPGSPPRSPSPPVSENNDIARNGPLRVYALHDYVPNPQNSTCLSFREGQVILVHNTDPSGWWDGEIEGQRGWFPSNYVHPETYPLPKDQSNPTSQSLPVASADSHTPSLETPQQSQRTSISDLQSPDIDSSFPALMIPLLHSLSLLQTAVRANRAAHFPPSTACIISCVRSILSATETLVRDAPLLQRHPPLAQERRKILSVLAALVTQAKKASEPAPDINDQGQEVQSMLRLGGKVFATVRRFLSVAVQCGIKLPDPRESGDSADAGDASWTSQDVTPVSLPYGGLDSSNGMTPTQTRLREQPSFASARPTSHERNTSDLRDRSTPHSSEALSSPSTEKSTELGYFDNHVIIQHKQATLSISSTSSSSSFSSQESSPRNPLFPSGPSTAAQVLDALRLTHDQYLSTIAAFIGHAHSHSRNSHASSTGHLYNLVREIVELVCKLLTIVEAVMSSSGIPFNRLRNLKSAKEGLYNVTSSLAESVRLLTLSLPPSTTEEEEKQTLLRSATDALKAGADCVAAVKVCLNRSFNNRPFIIKLPNGDQDNHLDAFNTLSNSEAVKSTYVIAHQMSSRIDGDDDPTIQNATLLPVRRSRELSELSSGSSENSISKFSPVSDDTPATSPDDTQRKSLSFIKVTRSAVEPDLPSPSSLARTEDDGTTWEGSLENRAQDGEERPYNKEFATESLQLSPELIEDPTVWMLSHDYSLEDVAYNTEGHLVGSTMEALVEKMTPHDSLVDPAFSAVFFMTFRLFSSPAELVNTIIARYNILPPKGISEVDMQIWQQRKGIPVRLRVSNLIKVWVETYWRPGVDDLALPSLLMFTRNELAKFSPTPAQRILELINLRRQTTDYTISPKGDRTRDPGMSINPPSAILLTSEVPRPSMNKTLLVALRKREFVSIAITDFDALELARQLTIMECNLYCAILPEEILEPNTTGAKPPTNVKAVTSLSTVITGWVAESILDEPDLKRRTNLVRFFIKVADRCTSLHNYSTSRSILAALDSSTIARLHQTWLGIPQKYRSQLDSLRRLADHSRNYHEYRARLRNTAPPAVPFLGLYLTDVTFCREGNPSHRASPINPNKKLLNFNKYHKLARIIQDMQRFQVPYNLKAISEVQEYLNGAFEKARNHGGLDDLYRRSLLVEPRQPADTAPTSDMRQFFNWASRSTSQTATASS